MDVRGLLTTVNSLHARVAMHAVRVELLRLQAAAVGLPLLTVEIPSPGTNEQYERAMQSGVDQLTEQGITHVAFGDLLLEDVREYREQQMRRAGLTPVFPIWGEDTHALALQMVAEGVKAIVTCVDLKRMPAEFVGREFDEQFLADLPTDVDPCGENGEFHTFAYAGPAFAHEVRVVRGEVVERDGFVFADLLPA